jgi:hypothetical protein
MATSVTWEFAMDVTKRDARDVRRFHSGYEVNGKTGCWEWRSNIQVNGYGHMKHSGKTRSVHRISYEMHKGLIPVGAYVLHRCDNRRCVNPSHLFLGSALDNILDMRQKLRHTFGEKSPNVKLDEKKVLQMYALFDRGIGTPTVSRRFGISKNLAWRIKKGLSWAHLYHARYGG